ncbi:hypothetical protein OC835_006347, partial [Tilletia horrida]
DSHPQQSPNVVDHGPPLHRLARSPRPLRHPRHRCSRCRCRRTGRPAPAAGQGQAALGRWNRRRRVLVGRPRLRCGPQV